MPSMLIVYHLLPHYRKDVFQELESRPGWEVHFAAGATTRDGKIATMSDGDLLRTHTLKNVWMGRLLWQRGLINLLLRRWDHVVYLGDAAYISTWVGALVSRLRGARVSFWTIGWHRPEQGIKRVIRSIYYRISHQLLLYGDVAKHVGINMGFPSERMAVIHNSSSSPPPHLNEEAARINELETNLGMIRYPIVGAVIRLNPHKKLDLLIAAIAGIQHSGGPKLAVVLAGDGPDADNLRQIAEEFGVDLHLLGPIYGDEALRAFYNSCLVTVIPTLAGLSVLQSLKHGRPVITHNNPEHQMPEFEAITPGLCGALYEENDISDLSRLIAQWVSQVARDKDGLISKECYKALEDGWTPAASARLIYSAIDRL